MAESPAGLDRPRGFEADGVGLPWPALLAGWAAVALVVAGVALAVAGGAPEPPPAGLPDAGPATGWALPVLRLAGHAAALALIGALLVGLLTGGRPRAGLAAAAALAWSLSSLLGLLLGVSEIVGRPVPDVLRVDLLSFYVREVPQGRALLLSAVLAAAVAVLCPLVRGRRDGAAVLVLALVPAVPPLLTGHAAVAGNHRVAQGLLIAHVLAAVLWVGGLAALALLPAGRLDVAAGRFSPLALGCAVVVTVSGSLSAGLRLDPLSQLWSTGYGGVLLAKGVTLAVLLAAGAAHRRRTLPGLAAGAPRSFRRLAAGEMTVMAAAFALAVALSRTPLPGA